MTLRKRFYRNGEPVAGAEDHAPYLKPAAKLLDALKQRMQLGNLQQLAQRYVTETGAVLTAISRFGQDEIRIDVPFRSGGIETTAPMPVETPTFVRKLQMVGYTLWLVDGPGTGVIEYDEQGQPTGREFLALIAASNAHITDLVYAHKALWVAFIDYSGGGGDGGVLRINVETGETARVGYQDPNGMAVALTATRAHVLAIHDNSAGTAAVLARMKPDGELDGQGAGEYSGNVTAIFADDDNVYLTGAGGFVAGVGWQLGGTYLKTLSLKTLTGSTQSFVEASDPTASGTLAAWDGFAGRLLITGQNEDVGTYHDWGASGGTLAPIASYGFDWLTTTDPWVTCGEVLMKLHYSGVAEVQRGQASGATLDPYYAALPIWDGDGAVWIVHYTTDAQTQTLIRMNLSGGVTAYPLPSTAFAYLAPAIQLHQVEITIPATEDTPDLPDELPARELRILRSRTGYT